jgi:hypothetical protein
LVKVSFGIFNGTFTPAEAIGGGVDGPGFAAGFMLLQENKAKPIKAIGKERFINLRWNCNFIIEV